VYRQSDDPTFVRENHSAEGGSLDIKVGRCDTAARTLSQECVTHERGNEGNVWLGVAKLSCLQEPRLVLAAPYLHDQRVEALRRVLDSVSVICCGPHRLLRNLAGQRGEKGFCVYLGNERVETRRAHRHKAPHLALRARVPSGAVAVAKGCATDAAEEALPLWGHTPCLAGLHCNRVQDVS
jgi:hypothetical protein